MATLAVLIIAQVFFSLEAARRLPIFTAPVLTMMYVVCAEMFYIAVGSSFVPISEVPTPIQIGIFHYGNAFVIIFSSVFLAAYLGTVGFKYKAKLDFSINEAGAKIAEIASLALGLTWVFANLYSENPQILWDNSSYLAMSTPGLLARGGVLFSFMLQTLQLIGLFVSVTLGLALRRGAYRTASALTVPFLYIFLFYFSGHSRTSGVMLAALSIILMTSANRKTMLSGIGLASVAVFAWISALVGRGSGQHGFAAIPSTIGNVFSTSSGSTPVLDAVGNFFEGPFVLATSSSMRLDYPSIYKVLSFSPLPSFIDRFNSIRDLYQIRIGAFYPVSGYAEAYAFGPIYFSVLLVFMFATFRTGCAVAKQQGGVLSMLINMLVLVNVILLFAYNLRNGFRLMFYSETAGIIILSSKILGRILMSGSGYFGDAGSHSGRWAYGHRSITQKT